MPRVLTYYFVTISHTENLLSKYDADSQFFFRYTPCAIAEETHWTLTDGRRRSNGTHLHIIFQDSEKIGIAAMRDKLADWLSSVRNLRPVKFLGLDVQPCKSPKKSLVYITKEDVVPIVRGYDFAMLSVRCQVHAVAVEDEYSKLHPLAFSLRQTYNYMSDVWNRVHYEHKKGSCCIMCSTSDVGIQKEVAYLSAADNPVASAQRPAAV